MEGGWIRRWVGGRGWLKGTENKRETPSVVVFLDNKRPKRQLNFLSFLLFLHLYSPRPFYVLVFFIFCFLFSTQTPPFFKFFDVSSFNVSPAFAYLNWRIRNEVIEWKVFLLMAQGWRNEGVFSCSYWKQQKKTSGPGGDMASTCHICMIPYKKL